MDEDHRQQDADQEGDEGQVERHVVDEAIEARGREGGRVELKRGAEHCRRPDYGKQQEQHAADAEPEEQDQQDRQQVVDGGVPAEQGQIEVAAAHLHGSPRDQDGRPRCRRGSARAMTKARKTHRGRCSLGAIVTALRPRPRPWRAGSRPSARAPAARGAPPDRPPARAPDRQPGAAR